MYKIKSRSIYNTLLFKQWDAKGNEQKQNGQKQSGQKEKEKPSEEKGCHGLSTSRKGLRLQVIWSRPWKKPQMSASDARKMIAGYKQEYQTYKNRGGKKSYNSWGLDKGYIKKPPVNCCIS